MINHLFQLLPVLLAVFAAVTCARRFGSDRRKHDRIAMALAVTSALMLIVAQTSWWTTYLIQGDLLGTWFANVVWTIFNSMIMTVLILLTYPRKSK